MDGGPALEAASAYSLYQPPPGPMEREHIVEPLVTGIRAIDSLLPCGKGQRVGIFGGSGVGKSTLLGAMSRQSSADVSVIALIGERNREVRAFLEHELGPEGMRKSVVVVATSDTPAPIRVRACFLALAVAEYFRDQGASVLMVMDSVTRFAMAQREIGLSAGEPPTAKGYTPTVFTELPRLLERAGPGTEQGTITGIFSVLVDGDDHNEPVADAVRGILDGHIVMERAIAERGRYPAINILKSISRTMPRAADPAYLPAVNRARQVMATYSDMEELIRLGAYRSGSSAEVDEAIALHKPLEAFLAQLKEESTSMAEGYQRLAQILEAKSTEN
jgi:flagellum-specific ATP synthase